jgi:hypothetical protein
LKRIAQAHCMTIAKLASTPVSRRLFIGTSAGHPPVA